MHADYHHADCITLLCELVVSETNRVGVETCALLIPKHTQIHVVLWWGFCAVDRRPLLRLAWQSTTFANRLLCAGVDAIMIVTEMARDCLEKTPSPVVP